jgi:hypothetical protein
MVQELQEGNAEWFKERINLPNEGLDIRKEITDLHAFLANCEVLFGKRKGSNGFKLDGCKDVSVVVRVQDLYIVVHQKIEITNNTIGVNFAKAVIVERRGRFKVNYAFFVAQVSGMGARWHKGKGGHVDRKGKNNSDSAIMSIRRMSAPSLINLDFPIMDVEEAIVEVYLDEKKSSQIPKKVNLVQLLDVKD